MKIIKKNNDKDVEDDLGYGDRNNKKIYNENEKKLKYSIKNLIEYIIIFTTGIVIFTSYINYVTFKGELKGEHILYTKVDGNTGAVLKIDNKYLKRQVIVRNTKNLDYGTYLIRFEIKKVTEKNGYTVLEGKISGYRESKLNFMRKYILNIFDSLFITNENLYAFSKAAILGEKSEVSKDMRDKFKYTGLAHLIVISGTHISLVVMGIIKMLELLNFSYRLKYILSLVFLTLYCMLAGMSPGIMRAYIMGGMMILAKIFFEKEDSGKSLGVSFAVIIILNPYSLFDISMQLSYAAVIGIIFVYPPIEKWMDKKYFFKIKNEIIKNTLKLALLSLVIQITGIPLFLYYFEKLPLFSFLINTVGVPLGTVLIQLLFIITVVNMLKLEILNVFLVQITEIVFGAFEGFIIAGSRIPLLQISLNMKTGIVSTVLYYTALAALIKIIGRKI